MNPHSAYNAVCTTKGATATASDSSTKSPASSAEASASELLTL